MKTLMKKELKNMFKAHQVELIFRKENEWGKMREGESEIGIHRKISSYDELPEALDDALKDNFPRVIVYLEEGISKAVKEKYLKLIKGKRWEKSDIHGFLKLLNSMKFNKNENKKRDIEDLLFLFHDQGTEWGISKEQTLTGITWLRNAVLKNDGTYRNSKLSDVFGDKEKMIIKNFSKFKFVGIHEERTSWHTFYYPIYRTYDRKGNYFDYTPIHWGTPIFHN